MANLANIGLDDDVRNAWEEFKTETKTKHKGLCFRLSPGNDRVCRDDAFDEDGALMKIPADLPDLNDYDARRAVEEKMWTDVVNKMVSDLNTVRYIVWYFYYRMKSGACKQKIGLVSWVADDCPKLRSRLCGASGKEMVLKNLDGLSGSKIELTDPRDVDSYEDICKKISSNYTN